MKLFRTQSAALPPSEDTQRYPNLSRDSGAEPQFSDEILRSTSSILRLLESLLQITDVNKLNDSPNSVKLGLNDLRQSLLIVRPKNISLGQWESVFSDSWLEECSDSSNIEWEKLDELGIGACYSIHPEIITFQNGVKTFQYRRQFTDMNAFTIIAVKVFKADLDAIIKENLYLALFLQDVIDTLVHRVLPTVLNSDESMKIKVGISTSLKKLDFWWENSRLNILKEHLYERIIIQDIDFIRDVIAKGLLTKLPMKLMTLLEQSHHRLAPIIQLHPENSCLEIHSINHNLCCIYTSLKTVVGELIALVNGLDGKKTPVAKTGLNYICDNVMVRNAARGIKARTRNFIVQTRNRARSLELGGAVQIPDINSRQRKSGGMSTDINDRRSDQSSDPQLGMSAHSKMLASGRLTAKSSSGTPEPGFRPFLSKRRSNSASAQTHPQDMDARSKLPMDDSSQVAEILKSPLLRTSFTLDLSSLMGAASEQDKASGKEQQSESANDLKSSL